MTQRAKCDLGDSNHDIAAVGANGNV